MAILVIVALLALWLRWEYGHARHRRIATHAYHLHKKSRGKIHQTRKRA
jgi:uncharacterized membrane protein YozB (DUF420 family)